MKSKRNIIITLIILLSVGSLDWSGVAEFLHFNNTAFFQASAAKKKSRKKSTRKKKKRSSKKRRATAKRATATLPPVETPSNDSLTLFVNERLIKLIPQSHNPAACASTV